MLFGRTFRNGIHPPSRKKATREKSIRELPAPERVVIPLAHHTGAPARPVVEKGAVVGEGDVIGEAVGFVSARVHASISGKVTDVAPFPAPTGRAVPCVVIEREGEVFSPRPEGPGREWGSLSKEEILEAVRAAGIVGIGGAQFPAHVKYAPPPAFPVDTLVVNGAECEPYLSADHRLMLEDPAGVLEGAAIVRSALGASRVVVGIERNKPDAIRAVDFVARRRSAVSVVPLVEKYPQGAEKQLIRAVLRREVPPRGLPFHVGCVVCNVGTALAVRDAVRFGRPLTRRVVTVTGRVKAPGNFRARIGTSFRELIEAAGGYEGPPGAVVMGGPMMGIAQFSDEVPVMKGTSGILVLGADELAEVSEGPCIRCGRCERGCPMGCNPSHVAVQTERALAGEEGFWDEIDEVRLANCMECGSCSYVCPARRPMAHYMRTAKAATLRRKKEAEAKEALGKPKPDESG